MTLNTAKTFSMEIERLAIEKNISHMDAVLDYCHRQDIEPDTVGKLISKSLKEKIEANATLVKTLQSSIADMSTRMESFIAHQAQQMANDKVIQAAAAAQQTKMFEMLAALEARAPSGEAHDKKYTVADSS